MNGNELRALREELSKIEPVKSEGLNILLKQVWFSPEDYGGHNPRGDYLVYDRNRESSIMENVNYNLICQELGAVDDDFTKPVYTFRAGHWAVGWVEYIIVKRDAPDEILEKAAGILHDLAQYPILNDDEYSAAQVDAVLTHWENEDIRGRAYWCEQSGESLFAARRDEPTEKIFDYMFECETFY